MQQLQQLLGNYNVSYVCQTGSQIFCDNCNDIDYFVVVDDWDKQFAIYREGNVEYYCYSREQFEKFANMQQNSVGDIYALSIALGKSVYGVNPLGFYNWFDYKQKAIANLLKYLSKHFDGKVFAKSNSNERVCSKILCWAFATYFVLVNNGFVFSAEQKSVLQRCHDKNLPLAFAQELKQKLIALANE